MTRTLDTTARDALERSIRARVVALGEHELRVLDTVLVSLEQQNDQRIHTHSTDFDTAA